ncbi:MAG: hypothetical protein IPH35_09890 [Rhodoferax sp.]|nr:hypothetical protein [Rhodoferax sp.]
MMMNFLDIRAVVALRRMCALLFFWGTVFLPAMAADQGQGVRFATVQRVSGGVQIISTGNAAHMRDLKVGDVVRVGDKVQTLPAAEVVLRTEDAGVVAMRPNAAFVVEKFKAQGGADDHFSVRILSGAMRMITGWIGKRNPENYQVASPTSLMGIRGTDYEPYVLSPELAQQFQQREGTYNRVYQGSTTMRTTTDSQGAILEVKAGQVGFAPAPSSRKSRALLTALLPVLLDKVPGFYVPGRFDAELPAYAAAQLSSALAALPELSGVIQSDADFVGAGHAREPASRAWPAPTGETSRVPNMPDAAVSAPQTDSAQCPLHAIANRWLEQLDAAIAQRDAQKFVDMFAPSVSVVATLQQADGRSTQHTFDRDALMRSTFTSLAQVRDFASRRPVVQAKLAQGVTVEQCKSLEVQSVVIESGARNGQSYRLESLETFTLERRNGVWRATAATTSQR